MIYYEYYRFGEKDDYVVKEYGDFHYPYLHFHRNYEFVYVFDGEVRVALDGGEHILRGGQFILVFPNQIHAFTSLRKTHARVCIFSPKFVNEFYQANLRLYPEKVVTELSESVEKYLLENLSKGAPRYTAKSCLYAVCAEISRQTEFVEQSTPKKLSFGASAYHLYLAKF